METTNIFTGKTVDEAVESGLAALGITREEAEISVLDEGKKGLFGIGGTKAKVKIEKRATDGERAVKFIDGLFDILKINAFAEIITDGEKVEINVQTANSHQVIGHHGEVLDAIQTIAGAVANIGNEQYKKVVVDCENYRQSRNNTLTALAEKLAKKAVEKGRKYKLEPMNPYERRIIHSALAGREDVKTVSEGEEPNRYVVIIPSNLKTFERRPRGDRRYSSDKKFSGNRDRGERRYSDRRGGRDRGDRPSAPRPARPAKAKREIRFGTFLGNSGAGKIEENKSEE